MPFTEHFNKFACNGDSIETEEGPFTIRARLVYDEHHHIDEDDVHPKERPGDMSDEVWEHVSKARARWFANDWWYGGIILSVWIDDTCIEDHAASLWGIEVNYPTNPGGTNNLVLQDFANEMLGEALCCAEDAAGRLMAKLQDPASYLGSDVPSLVPD